MDVQLRIVRAILARFSGHAVLQHKVHRRQVQSPGGDVGGDHDSSNPLRFCAEGGDRPRAGRLNHVAVEDVDANIVRGGQALVQFLGHGLYFGLGRCEDYSSAGCHCHDEVGCERDSGCRGCRHRPMTYGRCFFGQVWCIVAFSLRSSDYIRTDVRIGGRVIFCHGINTDASVVTGTIRTTAIISIHNYIPLLAHLQLHHLADELFHPSIHRRGSQHELIVVLHAIEKPFHLGIIAEVQQRVGFVEYDRANVLSG
mmetsp:Transcript_36464/g.87923  ORF Transcript_36464/g.87923 Transcript_36464/m.87923 type:complete len:255 (+) Transcript_36464:710-1474(+)